MEKIFIVSAPGIENVTFQELIKFGLAQPEHLLEQSNLNYVEREDEIVGGIEIAGDHAEIYQANLYLRTASRVLVRLGDFHAAAFSELRRKSALLPWERFILPGQPVCIRTTCRKSRLYHSTAVSREITMAIQDRLGKPSGIVPCSDDGYTQLVVARLFNDHCTISIDSSGALLHRRGYRLASAKAPLRETLAAAMLLASGYDGSSPFLDPFCGSGTLPIEAALLSAQIPPGNNRQFAFMKWPEFKADIWQKLLDQHHNQSSHPAPIILGSDRDAGAIRLAQANAERAGVASIVQFSCKAVSAIEPTGTGWVVTNPPYGLRIQSNHDLRNLYAQFGHVLRRVCPGWRLGVLCNDLRLLGQIGFSLDTNLKWINGGLQVRFALGQVPF